MTMNRWLIALRWMAAEDSAVPVMFTNSPDVNRDIVARHQGTRRIASTQSVEFSAMYARSSFLCPQSRFSTVPLERKPYILLSDQARAYRRLQLAHFEQKAVISVRDESLCFRAFWPVSS